MQEKHENILGIQQQTSAKFNICVKIITVLYIWDLLLLHNLPMHSRKCITISIYFKSGGK